MENIEAEILKGLLYVIANIADPEYQNRIWIKGEGPQCSSFEETMCNFFDDYEAEDVLNKYKKYGLSSRQYRMLKKFYKCLRNYSDKTTAFYDIEIVNDLKWHKIQKMAKEVLEVFDYKKE